jgi:predicted O-methyltransferase YrrM
MKHNVSAEERFLIAERWIVNDMEKLEGWCWQEKALYLVRIIQNLQDHKDKLRIMEIGVYAGRSLIPMAIMARPVDGIVAVDACDAMEEIKGFEDPKFETHRAWWVNQAQKLSTFLFNAVKTANEYSLINLLLAPSRDIWKGRQENSIDLIHIDGNHSELNSLNDAQHAMRILAPGGFLVFDDANWATTRLAVDLLDLNLKRITTITDADRTHEGGNPCCVVYQKCY